MSRPRDEFWGGEDAAQARDEREMDRELNERYFHEPGLYRITTRVRQFAERAERAESDVPRRNVPWRRG